MILETIPVGPLGVNCYLYGDEGAGRVAVIDPGEEAERIVEAIRETGCTLDAIIATHGHFDHVGAVAELKRSFPDVPFLAHADDAPLMASARERAAGWGLEAEDCPAPDRPIDDGERIRAGGHELIILHTPGHSPGGLCLLSGERVFVGDTLFCGSVGRTDLPGSSPDQLVRSIRTKLYVLADSTTAYPGHGPPTTIGDEKRSNAFVRG